MEVYNKEQMEQDDEEEEVPDHQNSYDLDKVKIKKSEDRTKKLAQQTSEKELLENRAKKCKLNGVRVHF